ncbi:AT-rich interactive domain-containing protein 4B isoform X3 [Gadus morhua]|uniref:AT-rich interactive domain-containing protein 4B isoform X3 n=1 Tax=Gadus morhua TaxID=8049 RepID=UPI0011B67964|nr:AT-rich interactive domain-containing protein 4B isoform X3 [Gadus morhua]
MKTLDEPPYLTVGTDVSAKYRGAFCEAKIKMAKRLVKAKVTFKPDLSTAEVQDEHIKGPLKVGAVVEVKNQEGVYQEATINKLTDASIYTVVFDDGDEKTLRRSSLCLKGARHFAESETLDRLPLTNPEHFGTPVIGKKGNRGRRSNPVQEEQSSSSSSEEEENEQQQNEELFGKVVCVEGATAGDKKKTTWYPALVISPDCHEDMNVKKDNIFVRSFKDGKFCMVLRKDVREMNCDSPPKADAGLKPALDAALEFQRRQVVPSSWRTDVKEESSSSEDEEDEEEEEEQEEDASSEEEEEEVEPFPGERENFLQQLYKFMEDRGTPINKRPVLGYRNLNLFKLYRLVHKLGGFDSIESGSVWKQVYQDLGIPVLNSAAGYNVKCAYRKYLNGFEEYCTSTAITFRMDLPLKQPKAEGKTEAEAGPAAPPASSPVKEPTPEQESRGPQPAPCKEEKSESGRYKTEPESTKTDRKSLGNSTLDTNDAAAEDDDGDDNEDEDEEESRLGDAEEGPSGARSEGEVSVKLEPAEQQGHKENTGDVSSQEGEEEGEEFECYPPGMKVQVRYGRGRNLKTYEATVKEADVEGGEVLYLVHYCGWNIRYDEWVKADKIIRPANKNVPKIKHRKKIKNKSDVDHNRLERLREREDLGPSPNNNRIPPSPRSGSGPDAFYKMDDASERSTDDSEREDEEGDEGNEDDRPGYRRGQRRGPSDPHKPSERWETGSLSEEAKPPSLSGKNHDPVSPDGSDGKEGKRRSQPDPEGEKATRKRKSEGSLKSPTKAKTRNTRSADWLPGGSPRKEERGGDCAADERRASSDSSSDDDGAGNSESRTEDAERGQTTKAKGSPSKKYNGTKEKTKAAARPTAFWDIPEKRAKASAGAEEKPAVRTKGQKDVWSSIQAQWPKKTLKELFSDSDTEAANSPPPPPDPTRPSEEEPREEDEYEEEEEEERRRRQRRDSGPGDEPSEEPADRDKLQREFPSSGSDSVLNTPPTTPESPSAALGLPSEDPGQARAPSPAPAEDPALPSESTSSSAAAAAALPPPAPAPTEEATGGRSETDSSTVEVESLGGELQDLAQEDGAGSPTKAFQASPSCHSDCSLELSSSSQQDSEQKPKGLTGSQKRQKEAPVMVPAKKPKINRKSFGVPPKKNRKTAHSSDSEDQTLAEGVSKPPALKSLAHPELKAAAVSPKCPGRTPPSSHKYQKPGEPDHLHHRDHHGRSPRVYKWSFQMCTSMMADLEKMNSLERISFLQEKLQDIRNHYLSLKSEVASIDRRRKRMKKKERESTVAASSSSSSSSSSPSSSSLTAAVMLTLADPPVSSSSSSQNSGVSVECRASMRWFNHKGL